MLTEKVLSNETSSINDLFRELDKHIQENRYSKHKFVELVESSKVSKENIKLWAIQKYHQTYLQNCVFSAIHTNAMLYEDIRQFQIEQLIAEETAICDGSAAHYELMKRFAVAVGAHDSELNVKPHIAVLTFVNYLHHICKTKHPVLAMLAIYVNESQTPESVMKIYRALKKQFNLTDIELEWFLVHGQVDVEHAGKAKNLIIKYAEDCENFHGDAWKIVKNGVKEWIKLQDYYASVLLSSDNTITN